GFGLGIFVAGALADEGQRANHALPGVETLGWLALAANLLGRIKLRLDRRDHALGDLVLYREDVREIPIVTLSPEVISRLGFHQLRGYAEPASALPDGTFKDVADTEFTANLLHIDGSAFVRERRVPGDDEEPSNARQCRDDFLDHAVCEIFLLGITAHILERQYGNRWLVGEGEGGCDSIGLGLWRVLGGAEAHAEYPNGPSNVFERLLTQIVEPEIEL